MRTSTGGSDRRNNTDHKDGRLFFGDNLEVLRSHVEANSVDLVYLDPPFNSNANYNVLFKEPGGAGAEAQAEAFRDTWKWGDAARDAYEEVMESGEAAALVMKGLRDWLDKNAMMAYITMMAVRLIELRRVLKPTGSIYLHCDPTASHYLKIVMDAIFGPENFLSEVIWKRTGTHSSARRWGPVHDTLLFYAKDSGLHDWNRPYVPLTEKHLQSHYRKVDAQGRRYEHGELTGAGTRNGRSGLPWRGFDVSKLGRHWTTTVDRLDGLYEEGRIYVPADGGWPRLIRYAEESKGRAIGDVWEDIPPLNMRALERLGYPTQKPVALIERIIEASSNPGDVVLDPFCGCGTSIDAAQQLDRNWIGIDVTHYAITLIEERLKRRHPDAKFSIHGRPASFSDAVALAARDKHQFQWWAAWFAGAQAYREEKKGADRGIDGSSMFPNGPFGHGRIIISVKGGGNVNVQMVRDLRGVIEREGAEMGILVTLAKPTDPMVREALEAGFVKKSAHGRLPRLQIVTIANLFDGHEPKLPPMPLPLTRMTAPPRRRRKQVGGEQLPLMLPFEGGKTMRAGGAFVDPRYLAFGVSGNRHSDTPELPLSPGKRRRAS